MLCNIHMLGTYELIVFGLLFALAALIVAVSLFVQKRSTSSIPAAVPCPKCGMLAVENGGCSHCGHALNGA